MNICFIDFETTGIDVFKDNPIEFGGILINENGETLKKFHSFIQPRSKRNFSTTSKKIHGLSSLSLNEAPSQNEVLLNFFNSFGTEYKFAGWNINFDVSFFRRMCHLNNYMREYNKINHRHIDIQSIIFYLKERNILPKELKSLDDLIIFFNLNRNEKHNALEDAELTLEVYKKIMFLNFNLDTL